MTALSETVTRIPALPRLDWRLALPAGWLVLVFAAALTVDWLPVPTPTDMDFMAVETLPSADHWLGTDQDGRDIFSRVAHGARVSLVVGFLAPLVGLFFGTLLGLLSAWYGGIARTSILVTLDAILAFPGLVLAMALTAILGASVGSVTLALGVLTIPSFARISRARALPLIQREFVLAAKTAGAGDAWIMLREVLPNMVMTLVTYTLTIVSVMIVIEGALSFLGVGVPPPAPSWGGMISEGRSALERAPHISLIPAAAMFFTVLSLNVLGDRLRRRAEAREGGLS